MISEEELEKIVDEIIDNISENKYVLNQYSQIAYYFACISDMEICEDKIKNAIKILEENIKTDRVQGAFEENSINLTSKSVIYKYNNFIKDIRILVNNKEKRKEKNKITKILNSNNWGIELKKYCEKNIGRFIEEKKYAYLLDVKVIINNIKNKDIEQIYEFYYSLQKVYSISNVEDYFIEDKTILTNLKKELSKVHNVDKVKKHIINNIIFLLEDVIDILNTKNIKNN